MTVLTNCSSIENVRTCLSNSESVGLTLIAQSGFISIAALVILILLILRNIYRYKKHAGDAKWSLVQQPADAYMLSLFTADCLQAIGGAMSVRWVAQGVVQTGTFCSMQGAIQQVGNTGVAMGTLVIALHTFIAVWLRKGLHNLMAATVVIVTVWTFLILWVTIGWAAHRRETYFTPTPYWCWIGSNFMKERIAGDYAWLWLTLLVSVVVYVLLFLWSRGHVVVSETSPWKVSFRLRTYRDTLAGQPVRQSRRSTPSFALIAYPVVHSIVLLPLSIVRWLSFSGAFKQANGLPGQPPLAATVAVEIVYGLFGAINVILFLTTRRHLLLFENPLIVRERQRDGHSGGPRMNRAHRGRAPSPSPARSGKGSETTTKADDGCDTYLKDLTRGSQSTLSA